MTTRHALSIALGVALSSAGCNRGCAGDTAPVQPAAPQPAQPAPQPAQPAVAQPAQPTVAPLRARSPNATWASALPASPAAPDGAVTTADLDLDGTPDAYLASSCTVARHLAAGWVSVVLGTNSQPENTECGAPIRVAGHWLIPITGHGHETDEGRSDTWEEAALVGFPSDDARLDVWTSRVEKNNGDSGGEYRFEALGDDAVLVSAQMGDAAPPGQSGPMFQVVRWSAAAQRFTAASCWQVTRPTAAPSGAAACTVTLSSSFHLRDTQTLSHENTSEFPAGTAVAVLGAGTLQRGEATLHCVRTSDDQVGYVFVTPAEAQTCATPLPASN